MSYESVQEMFSRTAGAFGPRVAIDRSGRRVTYAELEAQSNRLANFLLEVGVGKGTMVGLLTDDPIRIITGILGVLKAGAVFVPLDPNFPDRRLLAMSAQVQPAWYVVESKYLEKLDRMRTSEMTAAQVICIDEGAVSSDFAASSLDVQWRYNDYQRTEHPGLKSDPEAPCSIYFTSGSTGKPKAILGRLKGIDHFIRWEIETVGAGPGTRVSQLASPSFDGFLKDVFVPLCAGGVVCAPASRDLILNATLLADWLDAEHLAVLHCVPSIFRALINEGLNDTYFAELKYVVLTGEPLYPADVKRWLDVFGERIKLLNIYGTTETSLSKFHYEVKSEDVVRPSIPVGKPIKGAAVMIMDAAAKPCQEGAVGEIYIRTPYRSFGYYGEPELTKEVFVQNPFSDDPADLVHKTGDYGRLLEDGSLEHLGRRDQQVQVRGVRVELGEVENLLREHHEIADVAVVDRSDADGNKFLVAYVTLAKGSNGNGNSGGSARLREYLAERLPQTMVPSAFVELDELPRTLNGKIDRKSLPALAVVQSERDASELIPHGPIEEIVAGIWCEVLKLPAVGRLDNFFNLGGHSLLATQVILRVRDNLRVDLPVRSMFENSTVAELSELIQAQISEGRESALLPIETAPRTEPLPLSFAQQRLWFQEGLARGTTTFHIAMGVRLEGQLNRSALEQSFGEIIRRHESLRTSFPIVDGELVQRISPAARFEIPVVDLCSFEPSEQELVGRSLAAAEFSRPFDLETGPLARIVLLRHAEEDHTVICTLHHIISDGWSKGVLLKEISVLYDDFCKGKPSTLPGLPIQYADFAAWQRKQLQGDELEEKLGYWKEKLADAPPLLQLATDRPRPQVQTYRGASENFSLPQTLSEGLKALSRQQGVTLFMTLLAAFQTFLHRYSDQQDIVVGTTVANRERSDVEGLIGFFVNLLALRTDCSGDPSFEKLLADVRETTLKAYSYQGLPFEKLVQDLQPKRSSSYLPIFQVVFSFQNQPTLSDLTLQSLQLSFPQAEIDTSQCDLLLDMNEGAEGLTGGFQYNPDLFDRATITKMVEHFGNLLEGIVSNPAHRLSELPLLSDSEKFQTVVEWNVTEAEYPREKSIHELIEERANANPNAVAAVFREEDLSYGELNRKANQVAHYLKAKGVKPGDLVGICFEHSLEEIVGLLGVLKAGAGYVPLDPEVPVQRLALMLADAGVSAVLTQQQFAERLLACEVPLIYLDTEWPSISKQSDSNIQSSVTGQNIAYVIYTSGSTGQPKGVAISHQSLVNYVWWARNTYLRDEELSFALYSSLSFDLTVTSIFVPLVTGNRIVIYRQEGHESPVAEIIRENQVGVLKLTPGHLALIKEDDNRESAIKRLIVGGEALTTELSLQTYESFAGVEIYNEYGPTEATVGCMIHRFDPVTETGAVVPIGRPAANARIYVLDRWLNPVANNVIGEVYIAGDGLAAGYWKRGNLTAERFLPDPFATAPGSRMYKTGDLARRLPDASLVYLGRTDNQVKLRGFRIELGEIEAALGQHEAVLQSAVMLREDVPGDNRLTAYVVTAGEREGIIEELQQFLRERLPAYMMPAAFMQMDSLPLTRNGKVDRLVLPAPAEGARGNLSVAYQEPETAIEATLALTWQEVLQLERVGIYDDFFELGGHSLLAIQIIHRINQTFHVDLPMRVIFDDPTIAAIALLIEETLIEKLEATPEPVSFRTALPLAN